MVSYYLQHSSTHAGVHALLKAGPLCRRRTHIPARHMAWRDKGVLGEVMAVWITVSWSSVKDGDAMAVQAARLDRMA